MKKKKITNRILTLEMLNKRVSHRFGKQKWIIFAETLILRGYIVILYEARQSFSKYLTVVKGGKSFKVRFSNHKPLIQKEREKDCDFFVGKSNFGSTNYTQALIEVYKFFGELDGEGKP